MKQRTAHGKRTRHGITMLDAGYLDAGCLDARYSMLDSFSYALTRGLIWRFHPIECVQDKLSVIQHPCIEHPEIQHPAIQYPIRRWRRLSDGSNRFPWSACLLFTLALLSTVPSVLHAQQVIRLYERKAPGSEEWIWSEQESVRNAFNTRVIYNVSDPTLTVFLPDPENATGTAIIVAPGGAFHILSIDSEGLDVARWLNERGVAAFVLKYRLVRSLTDDPVTELSRKMADFEKLDTVNAPVVQLAMQDGLTAVDFVRSHAGEYGIDPRRIGFMGFSAGGTVTMSVIYNADDRNRPDFIAPIYAYERAVIGSEIPEIETPIFVAAASDDQLGLAPHSVSIYSKWLVAGQPAELHMYEKGGHGFGMRRQGLPSDRWIDHFGDWLSAHGFIE